MKFPHTITLFNKSEVAGKTRFLVTVIVGCFHRLTNSSPKSTVGMSNGNSAKLYVPLTAETGGKQYVSPAVYEKLPEEEKRMSYTFSPQGDFYIVGAHGFDDTKALSTGDAKDVAEIHKIKAAELLGFGSKSMQHWEISAE